MKRAFFLPVLATLLTMSGGCLGQGQPVQFELESKTVGARYAIEVVLPAKAAESGVKYPAIYCTDWSVLGDYFKSLPRLMDMGRLTEPFVMIGIGQPGGLAEWATARTRDFTPAAPTDAYSKQFIPADAMDKAGGAARFIAFLRDALIPRIESAYPVDPARRGFAGYSLGALLGTCLLSSEPQLFQYYLLGSPSLWFNEFSLATEFEKTPPQRLDLIRRVYLSVGEEESWEMLRGFCSLRDALRQKGVTDSRLKAEIIGQAGHVGAMPIALYNGLRYLMGRK